MELAGQKCAPCSVETPPLKREEALDLVQQTPGWEILDGKIERTFKFPNFVEAILFANRITTVAEEENHHPDLHISWGKVRVELSTHAIGGLSKNDFIVAAKINKMQGTGNRE
ncbi:MAG: 4a-hydroxytetrahydrobiopterin dehydratase [Armatimonadetes bacterium]|nr:4a-hydroxytetrahydrobiopterin dehydratase [Armatimonadota bacterium]